MSTIGAGAILALGPGLAVVGGAFALGLRHGIDWDHIAAIADITSTAVAPIKARDAGLLVEPTLQLTDESHHYLTVTSEPAPVLNSASPSSGTEGRLTALQAPPRPDFRTAFTLATLYAVGHGTMVTLLGTTAIVASGLLPSWIDPIMGRVVGITLLILAAYLYISVFRYFRGGEFTIRSRWMLIFDLARRSYRWVRARHHDHDHGRPTPTTSYGPGAAYGIGLIHGVGAETGTQVLVIAAAAGASSTSEGLLALAAFVLGLITSNSVVTVATALGFVSARKRTGLYVAAGLLAATFSLVLGLIFVTSEDGLLPDLGTWLT